ncbi:hypothetical protein [Embleya sp. NPDC059237]|uniref:hypothetical protein n=1 Tax=Embleya sp. NPDC059237 TaxID=3346784 RepID=UPI00369E3FAC
MPDPTPAPGPKAKPAARKSASLTFRAILVQTGSESYRLWAIEAEHVAEAARNELR